MRSMAMWNRSGTPNGALRSRRIRITSPLTWARYRRWEDLSINPGRETLRARSRNTGFTPERKRSNGSSVNIHKYDSNSMIMTTKYTSITLFAIFLLNISLSAALPGSGRTTRTIENSKVRCAVAFEYGRLVSDRLDATAAWCAEVGTTTPPAVETDAGFAIDVMYTDWQAPGKANNADNPVLFTKNDFQLVSDSTTTGGNGTKELSLTFKGKESTIEMLMTYRLEPDAFYVRRNIAVRDTDR